MVCPFVDSDFETTEQTGRGDEFAKWKKRISLTPFRFVADVNFYFL